MSSGTDLMDHVTDPRNRGVLEDATAVGLASLGGAPPFVTIYIKVAQDEVVAARFDASGCGYTIAFCSVLTELLCRKKLSACAQITPEQLLAELDEVPETKHFCATLAVEALQQALHKYQSQLSSATTGSQRSQDGAESREEA